MNIIEAYKAALPEGKIRSKSIPHQIYLVKKDGIYTPKTEYSGEAICSLAEAWLIKNDFEVVPNVMDTKLIEGLKFKHDNGTSVVLRTSAMELKVFTLGGSNRASDFNCYNKTFRDYMDSDSWNKGYYTNIEILKG